ncbi:MAG: hypothetical protein R3251_01495 [Candidatus Spechtbacterales bacterium]|nr:hypothetical protein [Candidatus Spechtbacterales bacterium]
MKKVAYFLIYAIGFMPGAVLAHGAAADDDYVHMMDMHWGDGGMMGMGGSAFSFLAFLTWIVWLVVGVLLAVWLWQKINKK